MTASHPVLKAAALASAVLCAGAFVALRAGLFAASPPPAQPQPEPDADSSLVSFEPGEASDPLPADATFLAGSKSIVLVPAPTRGTAPTTR